MTQYLDLIDCEICENRGYIVERTDGLLGIRAKECECMNRRRSIASLISSGLQELGGLYTFKAFDTPDTETAVMKEKALTYCKSPPAWFFISGFPGSGKTHICTAICSRFIKEGKRVYYCKWTEEAGTLKTQKAMQDTPPAYLDKLELLRSVSVLYIDDFLKQKPTQADLTLAFDILNARYNRPSLRTILSSNRSLREIMQLDEATGSRIAERARGYVLRSPSVNRRVKQ